MLSKNSFGLPTPATYEAAILQAEHPAGFGSSPRIPSLVRAAAIVGGGIGSIVLAGGWYFDIAQLRSAGFSTQAMQANTAACLVLAGWALFAATLDSRAARIVRAVCAALVILTGVITLGQSAFHTNTGIDDILFPGGGRPAPMAAAVFVFLGSSLLLSSYRRAAPVSQLFAVAVGLVSLLNLVGQVYGVNNLLGASARVAIAFHSALAFIVLSVGTLLLNPSYGVMAPVTSSRPGGVIARRLLPAAIIMPTLLGWIRWQGQILGYYDTQFGLALFASSNVVCFALLVWTSARLLNRMDLRRWAAIRRLHDSEVRYKTVVESLPQMIWTCLPDGRCDYLSRQWVAYTGVPEAEQLGYGWVEAIHPEDRADIQEQWHAAVKSIGKLDHEYRIRGASGEYRWFRALAVPLTGASGVAEKWFGTSTDIQVLKTAEASLRESESSFRQLADAMPQIVWAADPDGVLNYGNRRWYDYTGLTMDQMQKGPQSILHPDDLQPAMEIWEQSIRAGRSFEMEFRLRSASGGAYRWHLGRAVPVRDDRGEVTRWFGTWTDIEEYKRAEAVVRNMNEELEERVRLRTAELENANKALNHARAELEGVLTAATEVSIISTDTSGVIRLFNSGAERMLRYEAKEVIGIQTPAILHEHAEAAVRGAELTTQLGRPVEGFDVFVAVAREGGSEQREWTYVRKDGTTLDVRLAVTTLRDSSGTITGFLGIATDVTARKSLERQLRRNNEQLAEQTLRAEEANRAKSEFLTSMSHEIRTPMNSILGMADLLWDTDLSLEQRRYVEVFRRAGTNLLTLINDILDFSKIESGHFELEHTGFDLESVIDDTIDLIAPKARAKGIRVWSRLGPGLHTQLLGDPTRLSQVLINLLGNAVKFTSAGEIVLTVTRSESGAPGDITFSVSDTGIGIPAEKLESIFDQFTQADSSTTRKYGGTGLGLAICRRIVERFGGHLSVKSTVGQGSTFSFSASFQPRLDAVRRMSSEVGDLYGKRALVVDDNATNCLILRETLSAWGIRASECSTAVAALAAASREKFDVIILDNRLPGMNGFELAGRLRTMDPSASLIMLSSDNSPGGVHGRGHLHLDGYALKPVKRSELLRLILSTMKHTQTPTPAPSGNGQSVTGANLPPLRILIAEDSPDNRLLVQAFLKTSPCVLTFVEDGQSAVDAVAEKGSFDLILMDVRMPVMDGLSATRAIRAYEKERGLEPIPIVALTADARSEDMQTSLDAGCNAHLSKPISKNRLIRAVAEYGKPADAAPPAADPLHFEIPEGLEDLIPEYVAGRKTDVSQMLACLAASDLGGVRTLAHNLKGSGASYGFPQLTTLGSAIETAAKESDRDKLAGQIAEFARYMSTLEEAVQVRLSAPLPPVGVAPADDRESGY